MGLAQLIKSTAGNISNPTGSWHKHPDVTSFILGIDTGELSEDIDASVLNTLISGIPTPWARAKMFSYAFKYLSLQQKDPNISESGLIDFFKFLADEWKGLVSVIAIYPDRVRISEPVFMNPDSDDNYEIANSFGRMLFEDRDLWCNQSRLKDNSDEKPYIQLVYYYDTLIGATSPFSIFFPGVEYSDLPINDIPWYKNGKFDNPDRYLTEDQAQKVYSFLKNMMEIEKFKTYEDILNSQRNGKQNLDLSYLKSFIRMWKESLKNTYPKLKEKIPSVRYRNIYGPLYDLLLSETVVYLLKDGSMTFKKPEKLSEGIDYVKISDLQNLLMDSDTVIGWFESTDKYNQLHQSSVHYLQVKNTLDRYKDQGEYIYFPLPLSEEGIKVFWKKYDGLLNRTVSNRIDAFVNEKEQLQIDLVVEIDRQLIKLNAKEYKIEWDEGNKKVLLWPNFTSDNWTAYYIYSEYPTNTAGVKYVPFYKQQSKIRNLNSGYEQDGGIIKNDANDILYYDYEKESQKDYGLKAEMIVGYPQGKVGQEIPVYEIIKSNKPIVGLKINLNDKICGYLILKEGGKLKDNDNSILDRTNDDNTSIDNASVGLDFGSNNFCAYYTIESTGETKPVAFKNRRVAIVGTDNTRNSVALDNELLFFQNAEGFNGQVKSWLHEHHPLAPVKSDTDEEIAGGVPVNEKNIKIESMDLYNIYTQAGKLHYNMKWLSDKKGILKKTSFLKTIWLQICADLYDDKLNRCIPNKLHWSYPGAMTEVDKIDYKTIYNDELPNITPILNNGKKYRPITEVSITESEAVCRYALSRDFGLAEDNLFLGIDVGGSTSDILVLAKTKDENNVAINKLIKQSSIRIAAGVFFNAIIRSAAFKKELYNFYENKGADLDLFVVGIEDLKEPAKKDTAPFYLNSIFDQLKNDDFDEFYRFMGTRASFVFTIPAFVTGLIMYYSGMLIKHALEIEGKKDIKSINLMPFGKGGRLFFWLLTYPGEDRTTPYFETCLRKGFGEGSENIKINIRQGVRRDNKSEVAMGLVKGRRDNLVINELLRKNSDIFGEKDISVNQSGKNISFKYDDIIKTEYYRDPDQFTFPEKFEKFSEYLEIYLDFVGTQTNMVKNTAILQNRAQSEMKEKLIAFLTNDPEWKKAHEKEKESSGEIFDYIYPFIIAEGMCFLENILIPEVFKDN